MWQALSSSGGKDSASGVAVSSTRSVSSTQKDSAFVKEWLRCRTTSEERGGKTFGPCVAAGVALAVACATIYGFKSMLGLGITQGLPGFSSVSVSLKPISQPASRLHDRARQAALAGNLDQAIALYRTASAQPVADRVMHADLLNEFGAALLAAHREQEALPVLKESLSLNPDLVAARNNLLVCQALVSRP